MVPLWQQPFQQTAKASKWSASYFDIFNLWYQICPFIRKILLASRLKQYHRVHLTLTTKNWLIIWVINYLTKWDLLRITYVILLTVQHSVIANGRIQGLKLTAKKLTVSAIVGFTFWSCHSLEESFREFSALHPTLRFIMFSMPRKLGWVAGGKSPFYDFLKMNVMANVHENWQKNVE